MSDPAMGLLNMLLDASLEASLGRTRLERLDRPAERQTQVIDPEAPGFVGIEHDHDWWLEDAARITRSAAWSQLDPQHVIHLLGEIANLEAQITRLRPVASEPF